MPRLDRAVKDVARAPEDVYAAFVDPEALGAWLPPDGMTRRALRRRLEEGGGFTMTLHYLDGTRGRRRRPPSDTDVTRVVDRRARAG